MAIIENSLVHVHLPEYDSTQNHNNILFYDNDKSCHAGHAAMQSQKAVNNHILLFGFARQYASILCAVYWLSVLPLQLIQRCIDVGFGCRVNRACESEMDKLHSCQWPNKDFSCYEWMDE